MKKLSIFLCSLIFILAIFAQAQAAPLNPISYDMINGDSGTFTYYDDSYTGTGNKTVPYSPLSGGLGDLTDGLIATSSWNVTPGPYVGWTDYNPTITFHFGQLVNIDTITFYIDDNDITGVEAPEKFIIDGTTYTPIDYGSPGPIAYSYSGLGLTTQDLDITIASLPNEPTTDYWVMVSEVEFDGAPVPEPATMLLLGSGIIGLAGFRRKFRKK